jgi:hypothetical protein
VNLLCVNVTYAIQSMSNNFHYDFYQEHQQPSRILLLLLPARAGNIKNSTTSSHVTNSISSSLYNETTISGDDHLELSQFMMTNFYRDVLSSSLMVLVTAVGLYLLTAILTYIEYRSTFHPLGKRRQGSHTSRASYPSPHPRGEETSNSGTMNRSRRFPISVTPGSTATSSSSAANFNIPSSTAKYGTSDGTSNPYFDSRDNSASPHLQGGSDMSSPSFRTRGELHRRLFYRFLLYSLLMRTICLPLGYLFFETNEQITSIVSWTLPTVSSALASLMLVLFLAHVVATLNGRHDWGQGFFQQYISQSVYSIYATIVALNCVIPVLTSRILLLTLWGILCGVYLGLFVSMVMYTVSIMKMLSGSMPWVVGSRLIAMSTVCSLAFILRSVFYGWETYNGIVMEETEWISDQIFGDEMTFYRTVMGYLVLELLPVVIVLSLMHRKKMTRMDAVDSQMAGYGMDAQDAMMQLEAGTLTGGSTLSPVLDSTPEQPMNRNLSDGGGGGGAAAGGSHTTLAGGVRRSFSANGGVAAPYLAKPARASVSHSQPLQAAHHPMGGQSLKMMMGGAVTMGRGNAINRSASGGASRQHAETASLLSSKTDSVQASSSLSYGTVSSS